MANDATAAGLPFQQEFHRVAATGIIWKKNAAGDYVYLLTKRAPDKKRWPNKWTVPGGGLITDDYLQNEATCQTEESLQWYNAVEHTLRREIKEEVGLDVSDIQYLLNVAFVRHDGEPVLVLSFYCAYNGGEVVLDSEATEYAWITVDEIPNYDLIQGLDREIMLAHERLTMRIV